MKPITVSEQNWTKLQHRLSNDYPPSWTMIRTVMKDRLGFTVRRHTEYFDSTQAARDIGVPEIGRRRQPYRVICLDFYDEAKRTMFLLKYSDWITK